MNKMERRLRDGDVGNWTPRKNQERYELRTLRPRKVDTSEARDASG